MQTFLNCLKIPALRTAMIAIFLLGMAAAATRPYQSLIAIQQFGMSDTSFSKMMLATSVLAILYTVGLGNLSDILNNRRKLLLIGTSAGILGFGSIFFFHSPVIFIFATLFIIPISGSQFSMLFGAVRAQTKDFPQGEAAATNSMVRSIFAASWILTPGLVALMLANSERLTLSYLIASLACAASFLLIFFAFPAPTPQKPEDAAPRPNFFAALSVIVDWRIALSVVAIALQTGAQNLNTVLMPLILTKNAHGAITDVGLIAGVIAALEIPFMLVYGSALRRYSTAQVLAFGAALFASYLVLLGFATVPWHFYALIPLNAAGAASILSIPMTHLQNLLPDKPGLGSSLQSITSALGGSFSAATFALGTSTVGYSGTAFFAATIAVLSAVAVLALERR